MSESRHVVCPHCDTVNRIPVDRITGQPKCGKCGDGLFTGHPVELTEGNFRKHVDRSDIPVIVDFWAPWCGPCKMMAPHFERAASEMEPGLRFAKLNTDEAQSLAASYRIQGIPTIALFSGGREIARQSGAMGAADIVRWVRENL